MCVKKSSIYMSGRGHGAGAELLSSRRAFLSCGVCASSSSALRFSAALLASGAGAGAFFFFFTTIDVRSFTGRFGRDTGGAAALSSRSSARCANSGADSPPSRSSLGADFSSSTWSEHSAARRRRGCWGCYKQVMSRGSRCEQVKKKKKRIYSTLSARSCFNSPSSLISASSCALLRFWTSSSEASAACLALPSSLPLPLPLPLPFASEGSGKGGRVSARPACNSTKRASMLSRARCA